VLNESGIDRLQLSQEARQLLAVPLHLKLFIDILSKNPAIDIIFTLQGLLEAIWQQSVLTTNGVIGKMELIQIVSQTIINNEDYWIPRALADNYKDALLALESDEILVPDDTGLRIGFRHQTFFDFARARYFAQGRESLTDYVLKRQDGLFIRPILLSSLEYLRGADPVNYHKELLALWGYDQLRTHLRSLLTEYLAVLEHPDDIEINCLLPILKDDSKMSRALFSMAGSIGWFTVIKNGILIDIMSRPANVAQVCIPLLTQALSFARSDVMRLLESYWLPDVCYDRLILNILQYQNEWDEPTVNLVCVVARRTNDWSISHIGEAVSQSKPELAPKIVRADLDRRLMEAIQKDEEQPAMRPPSADASNEEKSIYFMTNQPLKNQKQLLETDLGWYEMSSVADTAPKAFIDNVWPWFICVLDRIVDEPHPFVLGYREDHSHGTKLDKSYGGGNQPVTALKDAIAKLADTDQESFLNFFMVNKACEYLAVHRLLCQGLIILVQKYPQIIYEYLIEDSRRLVIGDYNDCHKESRKLISAVVQYLGKTERDKLEHAVVTWNRYYHFDSTWTANDRRNRLKWNREHRLRLLRAFPDSFLSEKTKNLRIEEERAFPNLHEWDCRIGGVGVVRSTMSKDQMEEADNEEIINLFQELNDDTGWDHPRKTSGIRGGVIQASRELGALAEKQPDRTVSLLKDFKAGEQEIPTAAIIEGLGKSSYQSDKLFSIIHDLDVRGFTSNNFRVAAAHSLSARAQREKGLPDSILKMLENWLPCHPIPSTESIQNEKESDDSTSVLWSYGGIIMLPGGRDQIYEAIFQGYIHRVPADISGWAKVIQYALGYEKHPDVWNIILMDMPILFNDNKKTAIDLYDKVITNYLAARKNIFDVQSIAQIIRFIDDKDILERWFRLIGESHWRKGSQVVGELLMFLFCCKPSDTWAKDNVWNFLNNSAAISEQLGIAYTAAANWKEQQCQEICTEVLIALANSANESIAKAIAGIFPFRENIPLTKEMRIIIEAIIKNTIMHSAARLIEGIEYAIATEPDLVYQICDRFLNASTQEVNNIVSKYGLLAEPIVSIALTLHRMSSPYRDYGLNLFERLLESNIQEARYALDLLDRRPINRKSLIISPYRRRKITKK